VPSQTIAVPDEQQIARNVQALKNRLRGRGGRRGGRGSGRSEAGSGKDIHLNSEYVPLHLLLSRTLITCYIRSSEAPSKRKKNTKVQRKWGDEAPTETDMASLDFSSDKFESNEHGGSHDLQSLVDEASLGSRTKDGMYEVKDWEFFNTVDDEIAKALQSKSAAVKEKEGPKLGALGSIFARLTGGKVLTEEDLKPVLEGMKQHLMNKNVAKEISEKVCEGVGEGLIGKKLGSFQSQFSFSLRIVI
jgi:signal recognition particle receptor subunit alpha